MRRVRRGRAGGLGTPMGESAPPAFPGAPFIAGAQSEGLPFGEIGRPEEPAEAVLWLRSPQAPYVTGHSRIVVGGRTSPLP